MKSTMPYTQCRTLLPKVAKILLCATPHRHSVAAYQMEISNIYIGMVAMTCTVISRSLHVTSIPESICFYISNQCRPPGIEYFTLKTCFINRIECRWCWERYVTVNVYCRRISSKNTKSNISVERVWWSGYSLSHAVEKKTDKNVYSGVRHEKEDP